MGAVLISIVLQVPLIIASAVLLIAALLKMRKEKGSIPFLLGAVSILLVTLASPIVYSGIVPWVIWNIGGVGRHHFGLIYLGVRVVVSIVWAVAILLLSLGTFLRRPTARRAKV